MRRFRNWNSLVSPRGETVFPEALDCLRQLVNKRMHVRMQRGVLEGRLNVNQEDPRIGSLPRGALENSGEADEITFDDPGLVVDIETVENRAGVVLLDREQLARYPFLPDSSAREPGY